MHETVKVPETPDFTQSARRVRKLIEITMRTENGKTVEEKGTVNIEKNMTRIAPGLIQSEIANKMEKKNQDEDPKGHTLLTEILQQVRKYPLNTLTEYKRFCSCLNANSFVP